MDTTAIGHVPTGVRKIILSISCLLRKGANLTALLKDLYYSGTRCQIQIITATRTFGSAKYCTARDCCLIRQNLQCAL